MDFKEKDVVWVKLSKYPWWPAQVVKEYDVPTVFPNWPDTVCVKFFNEDCVEQVNSKSKIKPFNCKDKDCFINKGLSLKSTEQKELFVQALTMACNSVDGNTDHLEKLSVALKDLPAENRPVKSCDIDVKNNVDNRKKMEMEKSKVNLNQKLSNVLCSNQKDVLTKPVNADCSPAPKICSNKNCGPVRTSPNYLAFKSSKVQKKIDWNVSNDESEQGKINKKQKRCQRENKSFKHNDSKISEGLNMEYETCDNRLSELMPESDSNINTDKSLDKDFLRHDDQLLKCNGDFGQYSDINNTELSKTSTKDKKDNAKNGLNKKRKLTFDENFNSNTRQNGKKSALDMAKRTKTSTPKQLVKHRKNTTGPPKIDIIKTFTKLSQKSKEDLPMKPKRGRPPKNKTPDAVAESESARTPKSLKWNDSFELPTPSDSAPFSSFMTKSTFDPNLEKDSCDSDSDSDSDTELPEGLSPIVNEYPIGEKDIVWLRWKSCPAWPAFVRKIYRKKRRIQKLSLAFIDGYSNMPKRLRVTYRSKSIVPFVDKQKDQFILEGEAIKDDDMRKRFIEACEKAENFIHKKALVSLNKDNFSFFGESDEEEIESDTNEATSPIKYTEESVLSDVEPRLSDSDSESVSDNHPVHPSREPSAKEKERLRKMTAKQENLVNFVKSDEMKKYLLDIFYERRQSERHKKYFYGTIKEKNSLRYAGFGPIYNEDQEEEIVETTQQWLAELPKDKIPHISYILDVWIPEAIVYALIKVKSYSRGKAWIQFEKGVSMTKAEKERQHQSMMEFIGYTDEEIQEIKEKAKERMETMMYKHGLT